MAETVQRIDTYGVDDALVERIELERIGGVVEYRHFGPDRVLDEQRPATPEETASHESWEQSQQVDELREKVKHEVNQNKQFLGLDPPTNAQNAQQIQNLTRQSSGVMRQLIGFYEEIEDVELEEAP